MQRLAEQYFWLVEVAAVVLCSHFTASATSSYIAATYLAESAEPPRVYVRPPPRKKPAKSRSKSGDPLVARNMFCSECEPPEPEETLPTPADGSVPLTSLPLRLIATNLARTEALSFATIRNTESRRQGAYWLQQVIPDAGKVEAIGHRHVDFFNEKTRRMERIALLETGKGKKETKAPPRRRRPRSKRSALRAAMEDGIKKVGENRFAVDRDLVDQLMKNPLLASRGARIIPSIKNGKANGFKLYAIRPSSLYAKIGLRNGDTIQAVNGFELTSADKALEVYTKLKEASNLSVSVTRRGKPITLSYQIQ